MYHRSIRRIFFVAGLLCASFASTVLAGVMMPPGLIPGDTYHLAFITKNNVANATSSDITFYNNFVQQEANLGTMTASLGLQWKAIASTNDIDARVNAFVSGPVFLVDQTTKIADGFADLWDGSIQNPLNRDQDGTERVIVVNSSLLRPWTGSFSDGTKFIDINGNDFTLGGSGSSVYTGNVTFTTQFGQRSWVRFDPSSASQSDHGLFALSEPITVPNGAVPEPSSFLVWTCLACLMLVVANRRLQRRTRSFAYA